MKETIGLLSGMAEKFGTKFMLTVILLYGDWSLIQSGKVDALYGLIVGAVMVGLYYFARHIQEKNNPKP